MSWRRDLDLLHSEEVDMVLKPHPLSFTRYHAFFFILILIAFVFQKFYSLLEENASFLFALGFLDVVFSRVNMKTVDAIFLISFWIVMIISGWIGTRLLHKKMLMLYVILVAASSTVIEVYWSITHFEVTFIQRPHAKLFLLAGTAIASMALIEIYRRRCLYIVTNRRIIIRKGLILNEEEITYDQIAHIRVRQGIFGRIFNFGTIILISIFDLESSESLYREISELLKQPEEEVSSKKLEELGLEKLRSKNQLLLFGVPNPRRVRVIIGNRQLKTKEPSV